MGSLPRACLAAALAATVLGLLAAPPAGAVSRQRVGVVPSRNFTPARHWHVTTIVIHVAETSFWGTVRTLRDPAREASAHFVVSHDGEIVELVDPDEVAWHAGNRAVNETSIGIEHEGFSYVRGSITEAELESSARLVAWLAGRYGIPIDRQHIIGHDQVPDPYHPGLFGGADHHTDPGPYWPWERYLELVRLYAGQPAPLFERVTPPAPPALPERHIACFTRSLHSATIRSGQTVSGLVPWVAKACGRALTRVDFLVDGRLLWADRRRPFAFAGGRGWNTTGLTDGLHRLTLRAYGPRGYRIRRDLRVRVENAPYSLAVGGVEQGQAVAGDVVLGVEPSAATRQVELRVDGQLLAVETAAPFSFDWGPSDAVAGAHELELSAVAWDGRRTSTVVPVTVEHPLASPAGAVLIDALAS